MFGIFGTKTVDGAFGTINKGLRELDKVVKSNEKTIVAVDKSKQKVNSKIDKKVNRLESKRTIAINNAKARKILASSEIERANRVRSHWEEFFS